MSSWENFFIAEVGASAALTGLVFVGVSINLTKILSLPRLPNRALLVLIVLLTVVIVSSLSLVPGQPLTVVGTELLGVGLAAWIIATVIDVGIFRKINVQHRRSFTINMGLTQCAVLPYVIAGITVLSSGEGGLYWVVPAIVFSFIKAILDAWVLLVEINR